MPINKNAAFRYRLIDYCLTNRAKEWTIDTLRMYIGQRLLEEYDVQGGISERQLRDDFRIMRKDAPVGYAAPLKCRGRKVFYEDADYSIFQKPLIDNDIKAIEAAYDLLKQFSELPHHIELKTVLEKLKINSANTARTFIQYEKNIHLKGMEHIPSLYRAIAERKALCLTYRSFQEKEKRVLTVYPHLLKEYNNRWFLLALTEKEEVMWNFALDRIISFQISQIPYLQSTTFDATTYFKNIIGVTLPKNGQIEKIRLKVQATRAPYLLTKPLHTSQEDEPPLDDGAIILTLSLIINFELKAILLSFGADVEVLAPLKLRQELHETFKAASIIYQ